jgi:hypothetical protein
MTATAIISRIILVTGTDAPHVERNAAMGSTRAARRAGRQDDR